MIFIGTHSNSNIMWKSLITCKRHLTSSTILNVTCETEFRNLIKSALFMSSLWCFVLVPFRIMHNLPVGNIFYGNSREKFQNYFFNLKSWKIYFVLIFFDIHIPITIYTTLLVFTQEVAILYFSKNFL